jgi:hypothetical protein
LHTAISWRYHALVDVAARAGSDAVRRDSAAVWLRTSRDITTSLLAISPRYRDLSHPWFGQAQIDAAAPLGDRPSIGWRQSARPIHAANRLAQTTIDQRKINARSTIACLRLNQAGDMDKKACPQCGKILKPNHRGVFCRRRCVWRAWRQRSIARGLEAQSLPLATPPPNSEPLLPAMGPERLRVANQLALVARAPADARGYRVGIQHGSRQLMRWFPPARFRTPAMFLLDPFEEPAVPRQGTYAVVYLDGRCLPLDGPRFTLAVEQADRRLLLTDGDRTFKPRPRG